MARSFDDDPAVLSNLSDASLNRPGFFLPVRVLSRLFRTLFPETLAAAHGADRLPFEESAGYLISDAQRLVYRSLRACLSPHGVAAGTWFFLRELWRKDGLTQRELSRQVGILEARTGAALESLEKAGFTHRVRNRDDRRKINVFLTRHGRELATLLMPIAFELNERGLSQDLRNEKRGNSAAISSACGRI